MEKRLILIAIMIISVFGIYSFKSGANLDSVKTSFASYYHSKFNGKKTASGEIFSNTKMTAANKSLPFGTLVKVTNLRTNKSVVVKINDRGPYHTSRAIDLSKAAFDEIGNLDRGIMPIEYEVVN
ncbi:septal ring lytic transglycosylase RlpA family protein [Halpernia frigidisoli]|uniref:Probable endolytic peptidoglycan transglycosylase RlpA n=1 Tax=Halpernia frigidisoli TaxID=1125876 RepID=A0A1I3D418_9FLAO|nr:septal ring lytic transglycosylase RlpA family protein [Halpernia frigidisoli]SFH81462.1 rare lipoprotein A [Halpernia frigidisoli]